MHALADVVPELVGEVAAALVGEGRGDLARQLDAAIIERCTCEPDADSGLDLGYIYLARPPRSAQVAKLSPPVAETLSFLDLNEVKGPVGFNVDVDHDGHLFGIELLGRSDVLARLREADAI
jgi:hypothetical protein